MVTVTCILPQFRKTQAPGNLTHGPQSSHRRVHGSISITAQTGNLPNAPPHERTKTVASTHTGTQHRRDQIDDCPMSSIRASHHGVWSKEQPVIYIKFRNRQNHLWWSGKGFAREEGGRDWKGARRGLGCRYCSIPSIRSLCDHSSSLCFARFLNACYTSMLNRYTVPDLKWFNIQVLDFMMVQK